MDKLKNYMKRQGKLIVGIFIGVIIMGSVSYAVGSLSSESVSYKKKDGELTTVKQALDELISKSSKVDELEKQVADYEKIVFSLYDKVVVGDYVAYDAGKWDKTAILPTEQGKFGGYTSGNSKNASVACGNYTTKLNGWRVLKKENNQVYLVHAGQSECYYHAYGNASDSVTILQGHKNVYVNEKYAVSDHFLDYLEAKAITGDEAPTNNTLRNIGTRYWLVWEYYDYGLDFPTIDGDLHTTYGYDLAAGIRPVVVLKSGILTTGKVHDEFGQEAWQLVAMK